MSTIRGRLANNGGGVSVTTIAPALTGWTGSNPATGDIVLIVGIVTGSAGGTWTQTGGTGTWTIHASNGNSGGSFSSFCASRVFDGTETAPTFTYSGAAGTTAWALEAVTPAAGSIGVDVFATDAIDITPGNSFAINAATATATDSCSLILGAGRTTANLSSAITPAPPAGWVGTTNGADYSGFAGGASTRANIAVIHNNLGTLTGSVAPANETTTSAQVMCMNLYHVLLVEAGGANVTGQGAAVTVVSDSGAGSGSGGANAAGTGAAVAVAGGAGTPHGGGIVTGVGPTVTVAAGIGTPVGHVLLVNNFSGLASGTTITAANSGGASGNAFDSVFLPTGGVFAADNTHLQPGMVMACQMATTTTIGSPVGNWTVSLGGNRVQVYFRFSGFKTGPATPGWRPVAYRTTAGAHIFSVLLSGNALSSSFGSGFTGNATFATTIPSNSYVRIEGYCISDAANGTVHMELYLDPTSVVPDEQKTFTGLATGTPIQRVDWGNANSAASDGPFWFSDIGISTSGPLGPVAHVGGVGSGISVTAGVGVGAGGAGVSGVGATVLVRSGPGVVSGGAKVTGVGAIIQVIGGIGIPFGSSLRIPGLVSCDNEATSVTIDNLSALVGTSNQAGSVLVDKLT